MSLGHRVRSMVVHWISSTGCEKVLWKSLRENADAEARSTNFGSRAHMIRLGGQVNRPRPKKTSFLDPRKHGRAGTLEECGRGSKANCLWVSGSGHWLNG